MNLRHESIPAADVVLQRRGHKIEIYVGTDHECYLQPATALIAREASLVLEMPRPTGTYLLRGKYDELRCTAGGRAGAARPENAPQPVGGAGRCA